MKSKPNQPQSFFLNWPSPMLSVRDVPSYPFSALIRRVTKIKHCNVYRIVKKQWKLRISKIPWTKEEGYNHSHKWKEIPNMVQLWLEQGCIFVVLQIVVVAAELTGSNIFFIWLYTRTNKQNLCHNEENTLKQMVHKLACCGCWKEQGRRDLEMRDWKAEELCRHMCW